MKLFKHAAAFFCAAAALSGTVFASPLPADQQTGILASTAQGENGWFSGPEQDGNWKRWYYTVTDLDGDGRLELFRVKSGWEDEGPQLVFEELSEDGKKRTGEVFYAGGTDIPDLVTSESFGNPVMLSDKAENRNHYIFLEKKYHTEFESVNTKYALTLQGETLMVEELAFCNWKMSGYDGSITMDYYLPGWLQIEAESEMPVPPPTPIDDKHYNDVERIRFPGCEEKGISLWWKNGEEVEAAIQGNTLGDLLKKVYEYNRNNSSGQ